MSMYGVNASVPKTLVRHLVRYYADTCGDEELKEVLLDILDTPVSPELLPPKDGKIAQKTEDLVGPYELHDFYLYYMLRAGFTPDKIYRLACLKMCIRDRGHTPESLLEKVLEGFDIEINDTLPTQLHCNCCRERVEKALISIGRKELNEMIQEGKDIEMNCHFCNKNYNFTVEDLKRIIRECKR